MARPVNCRRIHNRPDAAVFKPAGVPSQDCEEITLALDELEAVRLADVEGLYQEDAARTMNVSRQTFGRILTNARNKIARAVVEGHMLLISGGKVEMVEHRVFRCVDCSHEWKEQFGTGRPQACPECGKNNIHRVTAGGGQGAGGGCRRRRGFGGGRGRRAGR